MPKFCCHCGFVISLVNVPSPHEASLISDADEDELCNIRTERIASFLAACREGGRNAWIKCYLKHTMYDLSDASIIEEIVANADSFSRGVITCLSVDGFTFNASNLRTNGIVSLSNLIQNQQRMTGKHAMQRSGGGAITNGPSWVAAR